MEKLDEHTQYIFSVNFSNDGRLLASGSADKYVIIWDCMAWQPLKKIKESYYELWGIPVKFSMDNNYLAYGSYETLKLVSLTNDFEELTNVHAHDKGIQSLDISSDNRYIITAGVDSQLKVWNIPDLRQISSVKAHEKEVWSTYISPDARYAVSGGQDGYMKIWNFPELTLDRSVKFHNASIEYVSISIGLKFVLCASADSTVSVWKWGEYDAPYRILKGHSGDVPVALFSNDERFVITGGQDDYIMIFDIESGSMVYSNKAHTDDILSLGVNQKGNLLASSSRDRTIKIWQITQ
jgi:WD40 repeat protein